MPTYQPVNPSLVAFNPSQVSDGMMTAFNLSRALEDIKAKKALQAELENTRKNRLEAQNAQNALIAAKSQAGLGLVNPQTALEQGQIAQQMTLLQPTTDAKLSDLAFGTAKNNANIGNLGLLASVDKAKAEADLSTIGPVAQAAVAEAGSRAATAKEDTQNATLRGSAQAADYRLKAKQALGDYDRYDKEQQLVVSKLNDALENAETDQDVLRLTRQAKLDKEKADIDYVKAHAKYLEAQGLSLPTKASEKISAQIAAASAEKHRLMSEKFVLPDGSVGNLASYLEIVYPQGGTEPTGKVGGFMGIGKSTAKQNKIAEDMLRQYELQDKTISILTRQRNKALGIEGTPDLAIPVEQFNNAAPKQMSPNDAEALKWLQANPQDPRAPAVRKKLAEKLGNI